MHNGGEVGNLSSDPGGGIMGVLKVMSKRNGRLSWLYATADRLEGVYLAILRIMVLIIATLALLVAIWMAGDGVRSLLTSTKVKAQPVTVTAQEVLQSNKDKQAVVDSAGGDEATIPQAIKDRHAAFMKGPFEAYYRLYVPTAQTYRKPEDKAFDRAEFAALLGYDLDTFAWSDDPTVRRFADDPVYAGQITEAARQAVADAGYRQMLARYKAAEKTAQACRTEYERRRGWDSNSMVCDGWWQSPIGCPVIRQVPVQRCEPAYPDNIVSPAKAFTEFDRGYRELWKRRIEEAEAARQDKIGERQMLKASGLPKLTQALVLLGGFLGIMFLFLVIAMERHLRRIRASEAAAAPAAVGEPTP